MHFGEKLKKYRTEHNLTQEAFAKEIGVSIRTLFKYETGQSFPKTMEITKQIASVMKVDYNSFWKMTMNSWPKFRKNTAVAK